MTDDRLRARARFRLLAAFGAGLLLLTGPAAPAEAASPSLDLPAALRTVLDRQFAVSPSSPGIVARVDAPGVRWSAAVGGAIRGGAELTPGHAFRIASVTKTFTAAAVLTLADRGSVDLDAPISRYLPRAYTDLLRRGGYTPGRMPVRSLLNHTSGLGDHVNDEYLERVLGDPGHRWTPMEQVSWAMSHDRPGERRFRYSDTGYVLLARIVERVTGLPQAEAFHRLLRLGRLGLTSTWFETLQSPPRAAGPLAHQYFVVPEAGLDVDFHDADPSFDLYGGGGLVSTVADLNRFYRALFTGRVVSRAALRQMLVTVPTGDPYLGNAGLGVFAVTVDGNACWWHAGFWNSIALYCPGEGLAVSLSAGVASSDRSAPTDLAMAVALARTVLTAR